MKTQTPVYLWRCICYTKYTKCFGVLSMSNSNTPYDDAFRTLLTDCSRLIIPVINLMFHSNYSMDDEVCLFQNESFITEGGEEKRITDSNFSIGQEHQLRYHIECQSSVDGTIIVRIFEYATQIAISTATSTGNITSFNLPRSGILYLRSSDSTQEHIIKVTAPNGETLSYPVPIIRMRDYTLEQIISESLWFLIPFYFFNFNLEQMSASEEKIKEMQEIYTELWCRLNDFVDNGSITEFEKLAVKAMSSKVAEALAFKFSNIKKGVDDVMGGQVLDYEAKRIAREAAEKAAEKARIEAEKKAKIEVEKAKVETEKAKVETEKAKLEAENASINAVKNMLYFGVSEEKILSKYPKDIYDKALKLIEQEEKEPKEM